MCWLEHISLNCLLNRDCFYFLCDSYFKVMLLKNSLQIEEIYILTLQENRFCSNGVDDRIA